jgi:hypothetical protein
MAKGCRGVLRDKGNAILETHRLTVYARKQIMRGWTCENFPAGCPEHV